MTRLTILMTAAVAGLASSAPSPVAYHVRVGRGAGVPAVDVGAVWVPNTKDGTVSRVDTRTHKVVATVKLGPGSRLQGYLDSAVPAGGSIWVARDAAGEIDRIDPKTNKVVARMKVDFRPGGLTVGGGYVWAFHFLDGSVTRIDPTSGATTALTVPNAAGTGIAYAADKIWLLTTKPSALLELDPTTGDVVARVDVTPKAVPKHGVIDTWWVAAGGDSLWLANSNWDRVARVNAATAKVVAQIPVPVQVPFGVTYYRGAAWVAGAGKVVRIAPATNKAAKTVTLDPHSLPIFTQVAAGPSGLFATDYDAGVLYRLRVP